METIEILLALEQCQMTYNLGKYNDAITVAMELIQRQGERLAVYETVKPTAEQLIGALDNIVWYNGHAEWLLALADELDKSESGVHPCLLSLEEWGTEKHFFWMLLVGLFGDWGTSVRSGWIEQKKMASEFIRMICKTYIQAELLKEETQEGE